MQLCRIWQKVCAEDFSSGKLQYENCEFFKPEIGLLATQFIYSSVLEKGQ